MTISRIKDEENKSDPILDKFLDFLSGDMEQNPQNIKAIVLSDVDKIESLVGEMNVDLDAPLEDEEE